MFRTDVYIEGQRLDLFKDETISIVSSVQNIEDISRTFNDYSQSFTVPATPNNNKIFKHWYNFSVNNGFDARIRHKAHIDIQSSNFKIGSIRLESCEIENNKPVQYKLTFFGQLIDLKSVISDDYLSALDLSQYDLDYTPDNIKTALTVGYESQDYIVPLISAKRQWLYNSNIGITTFEDKLANIAWNGSTVNHGIEWTNLRPALKIRAILDAIQETYEITFSDDFFSLPVLDNLYLWLANEDSEETIKNYSRVTDYSGTDNFQPAIGTFDNSTGAYKPTLGGAAIIKILRITALSSDGVQYSLQLMNGDSVMQEKTGTGNLEIEMEFPGGVPQDGSFYGRIVTTTEKTITSFTFVVSILVNAFVGTKGSFTLSGATANVFDFAPKIKVLDFLKSIISAYNLVVVPNSETDFYINTLDEWYEEGNVYDISKYVDTSKITFDRSKIYREISFKFQEPTTILADQFTKTNNTAYGDLETKLKNADGKPLDGEEFEIELDFEQMVYEKLLDLDTNEETNIVYGLSADMSIEPVTPGPHIFYAIQRSLVSNPISFLDDTGTKSQINSNVFMPSHADSDTQNYSTAFGGETNEHTGGVNNNSLYKLYYDDYIKDSFSIKRRKVMLSARLPLYLLTILKLNDRLVINGDRYIINEMTTNVTTQMVNFELLNDIYNEVSDITVQEEAPISQTKEPAEVVLARSFSMSATGSTTPSGGCALTPNTTRYWQGNEYSPTLADTIYTNANKTIKFNGEDKYFKLSNNNVIRITSLGIVNDVYDCDAQANQ